MKTLTLIIQKTMLVIACFATTTAFASCEPANDPIDPNRAGDEFTIPDDGRVPSSVIPDEVRTLLEKVMPIYEGKTPPDIKGEYLADSKILTDSNYPPDEIGKSYFDQYFAFTKGANGKIRFDAEEHQFDLPVSDDSSDDVTVYLVGTGTQFTAWFIATGQTYEIYNRESMIISGTLTAAGIENFHLAFVMLEKGADPELILAPVNTYRLFKESDGMAAHREWLLDKTNRALIVNGPNEAWTSTERGEAYSFTGTGTFSKYTFGGGVWNYSGVGAYKLNGASLNLGAIDYPYSITSGSMKITMDGTEYTFARTKPFAAGKPDEALILPQGQAWVMNGENFKWGYIFNEDGTYGFYMGDEWTSPSSEGTWSTSGNRLTINQTDIGPQSYTYTVAGGTLTMRDAFGDESVYTAGAIPSGGQ
jgi:hypothetical protein